MLPKTESWMSPEEINFRKQFPNIIDTVNQKNLLGYQISKYTIFGAGSSSVVAKIEHLGGSSVFKTARDSDGIFNETVALSHWSQVVKTPHILSTHQPDSVLPHAFTVFELITDPPLEEISPEDRISQGYSRAMGRDLAKMHSLETPNLPSASIVNFERILTSAQLHHDKLIAGNIIDQTLSEKILQTFKIISSIDPQMSLCHMDYLPYNIFSGSPLTIFDPFVNITYPLYDLANTLLVTKVASRQYGHSEASEILSGYQEILPVDQTVLSACEIIRGIKKLLVWKSKEKTSKLDRVKNVIQEIEI